MKGFRMAYAVMAWLFLVSGLRGPVTLLICAICLLLLFFETAFGICLGCMIYNAVMKDPAQLCPGGVCEIREKEPIQKLSLAQGVAFAAFASGMVMIPPLLPQPAPRMMFGAPAGASEAERCVAIARSCGVEAWNAGVVRSGDRQVVIEPLDLTFEADELHLRA